MNIWFLLFLATYENERRSAPPSDCSAGSTLFGIDSAINEVGKKEPQDRRSFLKINTVFINYYILILS